MLSRKSSSLVVVVVFIPLSIVIYSRSYPRHPWWQWDAPFGASLEQCHDATPEIRKRRISTEAGTKIVSSSFPTRSAKDNFNLSREYCDVDCAIKFGSHRDEADVVVFDCTKLQINRFTNTTRSRPSQLFVFLCMESPWTTKYTRKQQIQLGRFDEVFNFTMSYKSNSDIYIPWVDMVHGTIPRIDGSSDMKDIMKTKTKHSIWVVSDCFYTKGASHRMWMINKMVSAGLNLDLYGKCFKPLGKSGLDIITDYKFYLAFENSFHCREYITEKVSKNSLGKGAVPVIWGPCRKEVERALPPHSFIFVEDYKTPQELVDYLNFLDKNDDHYLQYFQWRLNTNIFHSEPNYMSDPLQQTYCELCKAIHTFNKPHIVASLESWWYKEEHTMCLSPYVFGERLFQGAINYRLLWLSSHGISDTILAVVAMLLICVAVLYRIQLLTK